MQNFVSIKLFWSSKKPKFIGFRNETHFNFVICGWYYIMLHLSSAWKTDSNQILHHKKLPSMREIVSLQFRKSRKSSCVHCNVSSTRMLRLLHQVNQRNSVLNAENILAVPRTWFWQSYPGVRNWIKSTLYCCLNPLWLFEIGVFAEYGFGINMYV